MKRLLLIYFLLSLAVNTWAQHTLSLADLKKEMETKDDTLRVINLWATWCKPCVEELPHFIAVGKELTEKGEKVKFMLVAVEDKWEKVHTFLQNRKGNFYVLTEKDANVWIPQIDAKWEGEIPATLLLNTSQQIRSFRAKSFTKTELEEFISSHLKKN
jgi:thiol-disulfide isomerase/thioredoxin